MKANPLRILTPAALALQSAACVAPSQPPPVAAPAPAPVATAAPRPTPAPAPLAAPADWRVMPATPGAWRWTQEGGRSIARFGPPGQPPLAWLICERAANRVLLGHAGAGEKQVPMRVSTTTGSKPIMSDPLASAPGEVDAVLAPRDPILDAIAFSRGRFLFEVEGAAPLYLPSWPELSRVIEDCR